MSLQGIFLLFKIKDKLVDVVSYSLKLVANKLT